MDGFAAYSFGVLLQVITPGSGAAPWPRARRRAATSVNRRSCPASATIAPAQRVSSRKGSSAHSITVRPASGAYCFGAGPPKRSLAPAAGMTSQ